MTIEPVIRAEQAHVAILALIHAAAFRPQEAWSENVLSLQIEMPNMLCLLDPRGGMILARVTMDEAEVVTLAVIPSLRRQGVAGALLRQAMDAVRLRGATTIFLEVDVSNGPAKTLYAKAGFFQVGRRRRYYANGADALILRADLVPGTNQDGEERPAG